MKFFLLLLTCACACFGQEAFTFSSVTTGEQSDVVAGGGTGPSYLISEEFDNAAHPGWTISGTTATFNDTTTPQPLVSGGGLTMVGTTVATYSNITATAHCYGYFVGRVSSSLANNPAWLTFYNSGGSVNCLRVKLRSDAKLGLGGASAYDHAESTGTYSADTTYHLWVEYLASTNPNQGQGDGYMKAWISTTGTKPEAATVQFLNYTNTAAVARISLGPSAGSSTTIYMDKLRVDDADIGSDPQ